MSWAKPSFLFCRFLFDDFVDDAVDKGFVGGHPVVAVHVAFYGFEVFAGVFSEDFCEAFFKEDAFFKHNLLVGDFAFGAGGGLVNHDSAVF